MRPAKAATSASTSVSPEQRRCGGCGRGNTPDRELCLICGVDLDTGLPFERSSRGRDARPQRTASERRERAALLVVGATLLVAAALVPLALLEIGPFAPTERLEPALLLRAAYPGEPVALPVETVATTTTASLPDRDLSALSLIDGDGITAWIGLPVDGVDAGEVIELVLERPAWVTRIQIRNGDHLSAADYEQSGRLQRAILSFDGGRDHRMDLLDIGRQAQVVQLKEPELTTRVTILVERVFPGTGTRGVALSEVSLVGWPADSADVALARQRAQWR
jgi:hypothetical protein